MAIVSKSVLKTYFETGDYPTQSQFSDFIDSVVTKDNADSDYAALFAHLNNVSNPHSVTADQIGLGNVDNTADINKPVSTAMQTALDAKQSLSGKNASNGYAGLDTNTKIPLSLLPDTAKQATYVVLDSAERNALTGLIEGDKAFETSTGDSYIWDGSAWVLMADADWQNVNIDWANVIGTPTTIAGYGITDAYTDTYIDSNFLGISTKAADSDKLNGQLASYYAKASDLDSYVPYVGADSDLYLGSNNLIVDGNVGIGTGSPTEKLDVNGNIKASGIITAVSHLIATENIYSKAGLISFTEAVGNGYYIQKVSNDVRHYIDGTSLLTLDGTNQRIGIGTITPSASLEVKGAVKSSNSGNAYASIGTISLGGFLDVYDDNGNKTALIRSYSVGQTQAYFTAGGIAIGKTVADEKLDVAGNISFSGILKKAGNEFHKITVSTTAPTTPQDGDIWINA